MSRTSAYFRQPKSDEEEVKAKLVKLIKDSHKVDEVVALANAFSKLRAVEMKQEEDDCGEGLAQPEKPHELARDS